jgi:hypothetical protein
VFGWRDHKMPALDIAKVKRDNLAYCRPTAMKAMSVS